MLTPTERNYHLHAGKLEFLALKWAVTEKFRDYLYYSPSFVVYTDNNPLTYVLTSAKLNATGHRWVAELADFNFTIKYRPGKTNTDADVLSRMPLDLAEYTLDVNRDSMDATIQAVKEKGRGTIPWITAVTANCTISQEPSVSELCLKQLTPDELRAAQQEDKAISRLLQYKNRGHKPSPQERRGESRTVNALVREWNKLHVHRDGILWRQTKT